MAVTAVRNPKVTLNMIPRDQIVGLEDHRVLLVGQITSAATASAGLVQSLPDNDAEINALFGARSHLAMIARAFRSVNKYTQVDAIALDDATGTNATAIILAAGTATEAKTIYVDVVSTQNHSYEIDVEVGDTPAEIIPKITAKVALDTECPFTSAESGTPVDTITFTSSHDGTISNSWLLRIRDAYGKPATVGGITWTLTGWASGATDPTLTSIFDPVENIRYHGVVWPAEYDTTVPKAWINARFNLDNDIKDGVVFQWRTDAYADVQTAAASMNSPSFEFLWNEAMNTAYWKGPHVPEAPDVITAKFVAARARRFESNISITDLVVNNEPRDQFGGRHTCTLPYFNTPILTVGQPERGAGATYAEQLVLEGAGVTVIGSNVTNNSVINGAHVTTYQNDDAGNTDDTWSWLNWRDTHSVVREFYVNNLRREFSQHRLTSGRGISGYAIADEGLIRAFCLELYDLLAEEAITVSSREARKTVEDNMVVAIVPDQRLVQLTLVLPFVSQLGQITGTVKFQFAA